MNPTVLITDNVAEVRIDFSREQHPDFARYLKDSTTTSLTSWSTASIRLRD